MVWTCLLNLNVLSCSFALELAHLLFHPLQIDIDFFGTCRSFLMYRMLSASPWHAVLGPAIVEAGLLTPLIQVWKECIC